MDTPPRLRDSIENLYAVFSRYPLKEKIIGCPCCTGETEDRRFHNKFLHELTVDDFARFAYKAMTTWGDDEDFRHFLPRIFELLVTESRFPVNIEIVIGKLAYGKWTSWPQAEQDALMEFMESWWHASLVAPPDKSDIHSILCALATANESMTPFLQIWRDEQTVNAALLLNEFIRDNDSHRWLRSSWWRGLEGQRKQVITWLMDQQTEQFLERMAFEHINEPFADELMLSAELARNAREQAK